MAKFNNENSDKKISVNTFSYTDKNYVTGTALAVKLFDTMASIAVHLLKEGDKSDIPAFDWDHAVTAYLSIKDCHLFAKEARKELKKYEETGEFETVTLPLKKGVLEISTISNLKKKLKALTSEISEPAALCATIYTDMNESKVPQTYLVHVFNVGKLLKDYEPETGKYKVITNSAAECDYFLTTLKKFAKEMTNCTSHALKNDGKFQREKYEKMAFELAVSLGVDLSKTFKPAASASKPSISWGDSPSGNSSINSRTDTGNKTETIEADEENVDDVIAAMIAGK